MISTLIFLWLDDLAHLWFLVCLFDKNAFLRSFNTCFVFFSQQMISDGIQRYQLNPSQHSACSAWHFPTWWAVFLKGVHRGVSFCERLNVVSSNMAAAETCPSQNKQVLLVVFKLKLFILWEVQAPQIATPHLRKL